MAYLRQPIISVLGHVDHGKTSLLDYIRHSKLCAKEAGGITQHIGATEVPKKEIVQIVKKSIPEDRVKIPGLLFIDTPGHKAFTSLRKRGGSIADIGILVVDLNEGFKPQTEEAVEILKASKTPFIVAANKVDLVPRWLSHKEKSMRESLELQQQEALYKLDERVYTIVGKLSELGYESERFDRVTDFTKTIAIVPISAKSGEGITELITTLVGLTQKYMEKKLTITQEDVARGVILEVKEYPGLGKTCDVIFYDGVAKQGDRVFALDIDGVQESKLKSILKPSELKEIRDSSTKFTSFPQVAAAAGVKLSCPDFKDIMAGMPLICLRKDAKDQAVIAAKEELEKEKAEICMKVAEQGVLVKADTLGSLEAISHILEEHQIPLRKALLGKLSKQDILDVASDLEKHPQNALVLNFSQSVDPDVELLSKNYNVTIISSEIIYKLVDDAKLWVDNKNKEILRKRLESLILPFKIKILKNCIFRASGPAIVGVEVLGGTLKRDVQLITEEGKRIGFVKSIKNGEENMQELKQKEQAAVGIDDLIVGRHAQEDTVIYAFMGEENFRALKRNIDLLSKDEVQVLKELAELMRKEDTLWGL
jgi:translation initiation factor 5B